MAGGDPVELAGDGCWLSHDERYEAASEFLDVWKGVLSGQVVDLEGKHITVKGAQQLFPRSASRIHRCILAARRRQRTTWPPAMWICT